MAEADRNSKIKSLSLTASRLFSEIPLKPSCLATNSLSIGKKVPAKAAEPKGRTLKRFSNTGKNLSPF